MRATTLRRIVSLLTLIVYVLTSHMTPAVFADTQIPVQPVKKHRTFDVAALEVPSDIGIVHDKYIGSRQGTVILIQDAHAVPGAQFNIQAIINHLQKNYKINGVALEGAASKLDPQIFRSFPDKKRLEKVFTEYLQAGELSGVSAAAVLNDEETEFYGIENWDLYQKGIRLFLAAMSKGEEAREALSIKREAIEKEKEKFYSQELLELDRSIDGFYQKKTHFAELLEKLSLVQKPAAGSALALLAEELKGTAARSTIDSAIKDLVLQIKAKINPRHLPEFNRRYQAYQTGQAGAAAFAAYLKKTAEHLPSSVAFSEEIIKLISKQQRLEDIQGTEIHDEFEAYIQIVKETLFENDTQRTLDRRAEKLRLLTKLAKLELTWDEWARIKMSIADSSWLTEKEKLKEQTGFYETAEARDHAFFENLKKDQTSILVAGGFHTQGLTRLLKESGLSYALITPQIHEIPETTHYREVMRGEVSWKNYFKTEQGRINLYDAFVRGTRDQLLVGSVERRAMLKLWKDQLIRDLVNQKRAGELKKYVRFLDEVTGSRDEQRGLKGLDLVERAEKFIEGLRHLKAASQLSEANILKLVQPATTQAWPSIGLAPDRVSETVLKAESQKEDRALVLSFLDRSELRWTEQEITAGKPWLEHPALHEEGFLKDRPAMLGFLYSVFRDDEDESFFRHDLSADDGHTKTRLQLNLPDKGVPGPRAVDAIVEKLNIVWSRDELDLIHGPMAYWIVQMVKTRDALKLLALEAKLRQLGQPLEVLFYDILRTAGHIAHFAPNYGQGPHGEHLPGDLPGDPVRYIDNEYLMDHLDLFIAHLIEERENLIWQQAGLYGGPKEMTLWQLYLWALARAVNPVMYNENHFEEMVRRFKGLKEPVSGREIPSGEIQSLFLEIQSLLPDIESNFHLLPPWATPGIYQMYAEFFVDSPELNVSQIKNSVRAKEHPVYQGAYSEESIENAFLGLFGVRSTELMHNVQVITLSDEGAYREKLQWLIDQFKPRSELRMSAPAQNLKAIERQTAVAAFAQAINEQFTLRERMSTESMIKNVLELKETSQKVWNDMIREERIPLETARNFLLVLDSQEISRVQYMLNHVLNLMKMKKDPIRGHFFDALIARYRSADESLQIYEMSGQQISSMSGIKPFRAFEGIVRIVPQALVKSRIKADDDAKVLAIFPAASTEEDTAAISEYLHVFDALAFATFYEREVNGRKALIVSHIQSDAFNLLGKELRKKYRDWRWQMRAALEHYAYQHKIELILSPDSELMGQRWPGMNETARHIIYDIDMDGNGYLKQDFKEPVYWEHGLSSSVWKVKTVPQNAKYGQSMSGAFRFVENDALTAHVHYLIAGVDARLPLPPASSIKQDMSAMIVRLGAIQALAEAEDVSGRLQKVILGLARYPGPGQIPSKVMNDLETARALIDEAVAARKKITESPVALTQKVWDQIEHLGMLVGLLYAEKKRNGELPLTIVFKGRPATSKSRMIGFLQTALEELGLSSVYEEQIEMQKAGRFPLVWTDLVKQHAGKDVLIYEGVDRFPGFNGRPHLVIRTFISDDNVRIHRAISRNKYPGMPELVVKEQARIEEGELPFPPDLEMNTTDPAATVVNRIPFVTHYLRVSIENGMKAELRNAGQEGPALTLDFDQGHAVLKEQDFIYARAASFDAVGNPVIFRREGQPSRILRISREKMSNDIERRRELEALSRLSADPVLPGIPRLIQYGRIQNIHGFLWAEVEGLPDGQPLKFDLGKKAAEEQKEALGFILQNDPVKTVDVLIRTARIVEDIHQRGLLHNDIKPANILINENGEIMLIDFELASEPGAEIKWKTPHFGAPENKKDFHSDVYSLVMTVLSMVDDLRRISGNDKYRSVLDDMVKTYSAYIFNVLELDPQSSKGITGQMSDLRSWQTLKRKTEELSADAEHDQERAAFAALVKPKIRIERRAAENRPSLQQVIQQLEEDKSRLQAGAQTHTELRADEAGSRVPLLDSDIWVRGISLKDEPAIAVAEMERMLSQVQKQLPATGVPPGEIDHFFQVVRDSKTLVEIDADSPSAGDYLWVLYDSQEGGSAVGFLHLTKNAEASNEGYAGQYEIAVHPGRRREGIAAALITHVLEFLKQSPQTGIEVFSGVINPLNHGSVKALMYAAENAGLEIYVRMDSQHGLLNFFVPFNDQPVPDAELFDYETYLETFHSEMRTFSNNARKYIAYSAESLSGPVDFETAINQARHITGRKVVEHPQRMDILEPLKEGWRHMNIVIPHRQQPVQLIAVRAHPGVKSDQIFYIEIQDDLENVLTSMGYYLNRAYPGHMFDLQLGVSAVPAGYKDTLMMTVHTRDGQPAVSVSPAEQLKPVYSINWPEASEVYNNALGFSAADNRHLIQPQYYRRRDGPHEYHSEQHHPELRFMAESAAQMFVVMYGDRTEDLSPVQLSGFTSAAYRGAEQDIESFSQIFIESIREASVSARGNELENLSPLDLAYINDLTQTIQAVAEIISRKYPDRGAVFAADSGEENTVLAANNARNHYEAVSRISGLIDAMVTTGPAAEILRRKLMEAGIENTVRMNRLSRYRPVMHDFFTLLKPKGQTGERITAPHFSTGVDEHGFESVSANAQYEQVFALFMQYVLGIVAGQVLSVKDIGILNQLESDGIDAVERRHLEDEAVRIRGVLIRELQEIPGMARLVSGLENGSADIVMNQIRAAVEEFKYALQTMTAA